MPASGVRLDLLFLGKFRHHFQLASNALLGRMRSPRSACFARRANGKIRRVRRINHTVYRAPAAEHLGSKVHLLTLHPLLVCVSPVPQELGQLLATWSAPDVTQANGSWRLGRTLQRTALNVILDAMPLPLKWDRCLAKLVRMVNGLEKVEAVVVRNVPLEGSALRLVNLP